MQQEGSPVSGLTLEEVAKLFENWRQTKPRRRAIPPTLWQAAVDLSSKHSLSQISRSLGLSYTELKNRVSALSESQGVNDPCPEFIELDVGRRFPATSCVLEKEDKHGTRTTMSIQLAGSCDLRELIEAFCCAG